MRLTRRRLPRPPVEVEAGEKLLAWAEAEAGPLVGTRDALYITSTADPDESRRIPWEQVQAADWDPDIATLRIAEVGIWGEPRPVHLVVVSEPGRLLELVRERVTASILLQRHVPVAGHTGLRLIARRPPGRPGSLNWIFEYDEGLDPDDPVVRLAAEEALTRAREELGLR